MSTAPDPAPLGAPRAALVACIAALAAASCITRGELESLKTSQDELVEGQKALRSDLVAVRKLLESRPPSPAPPPLPRGPDPQKTYSFPIGDSPVRGPADAWVTVVAISDFECPFCDKVNGTLREIEQSYGREVRLVFKNNPLIIHQRAMPAAIAALCAHRQQKFWPMHDRIFANQRALGEEDITGYAKALGLRMDVFAKCQQSPDAKRRVEEDIAQATRLGARGTPAFFINGRFLSGAQQLPVFKALIDEELKKAQKSGVPRREYYARVVVDGGDKAM